jgi:hypothetical protein
MHRLFAYADESNLSDVEGELMAAFDKFASSWGVDGVRLRNTKAPLMSGQANPDWNIGLSVEAPELRRHQLEQLLSFLANLSREVELPFVVGTWQPRGESRDLCVVDRHVADGSVGLILEQLNAP